VDEPEQDWVRRVFEITGRTLGVKPEPRAQTYNTDAGNLLKVYKGAPTVVLGRASRSSRTRPTSTAAWSASGNRSRSTKS